MLIKKAEENINFFLKKVKKVLDFYPRNAYINNIRKRIVVVLNLRRKVVMNYRDMSKKMAQTMSDKMREEWLAKGNKVTTVKASTKRVKTFGSKGARFNRGAKSNTLRNQGFAKAQ